jgi:DNA-binding response OmpR family regulator
MEASMTVVVLRAAGPRDRPPGRRRTVLRLRTSTVEHFVRPRPPAVPPDAASVVIHADSREVWSGERVVPFTRIEFDLLLFLASHPRRVFTREQLLERVWGFGRGGVRTVDVHIRRLRAKLTERPVVTTVRGVGYRLADDADLRVVRLGSARP